MLSATFFMGMEDDQYNYLTRFVPPENEFWLSASQLRAQFCNPDSTKGLRSVNGTEVRSHCNVAISDCDRV